MIPRPARPPAWLLRLLAGLAVSVGTACDEMPLLAPTQSTITLSSAHLTLPLNGSTDITATVIEQSGTPVHNGTLVTFTATLGTVEPREARTEAGKVVVRFLAGNQSGTARIGAFSGPARATDLEIKIGGAAAERIVLLANPTTVSARGGTAEIVATVSDGAGNPLPEVPVRFSASAGTLSAATVTTDTAGQARTHLTTDRETTVTATAGNQQAQLTIRVSAPPTVSITVAATPTAGQPASFTVTVTPGGSPVREVTIDFGDGSSQLLGALAGSITVAHVYETGGSFTVTVTATDTAGTTTAVSTAVHVTPATPLGVTITPSSATPSVNTPVTFTATVTPNTAAIQRYVWSWGDGSADTITSGNSTTHVYTSTGTKIVRVTVTAVDGRTAQGVIEIRVQ
jgi:predicted secreted protein